MGNKISMVMVLVPIEMPISVGNEYVLTLALNKIENEVLYVKCHEITCIDEICF